MPPVSNSNSSTQRDDSERRDFFRIDDEIYLSYQLVDDAELEYLKKAVLNDTNYRVKGSGSSLAHELSIITQRLNQQLKGFKNKHPDIARCLYLLNDKIDLIARSTVLASSNEKLDPNMEVNISASGMAFVSPEELPVDAHLEISFLLFPSFKQIHAVGQVKSVAAITDNGSTLYKTAVHFVSISEKNQDALHNHNFNKEIQSRRLNR